MTDPLLNRPEIEGVAIACGLCCVDGFGKTVCTAFSGMEHVLKFAHEIERAARKAAIRDLYAVIDNDAYAVSFQTMGQYRAALRSAIRALREES